MDQTPADQRFVAAVAAFGMVLGDSPRKGAACDETILPLARSAVGGDPGGYRSELVRLVELARGVRPGPEGNVGEEIGVGLIAVMRRVRPSLDRPDPSICQHRGYIECTPLFEFGIRCSKKPGIHSEPTALLNNGMLQPATRANKADKAGCSGKICPIP